MNSFRFLQKALEFEIERQIELVESGGRVRQETRLWDSETGETMSMRSKEEAHDYRYFPEPDLPPLVVDAAWIDAVRAVAARVAGGPQGPADGDATRSSDYDADQLVRRDRRRRRTTSRRWSRPGRSPKAASNWIQGEIRREAEGPRRRRHVGVSDRRRSGWRSWRSLTERGVISSSVAKEVFEKMWSTGASGRRRSSTPKGSARSATTSALQAMVDEVIRANPDTVAQYRAGRTATLGFLVGQVMKASGARRIPRSSATCMKACVIIDAARSGHRANA